MKMMWFTEFCSVGVGVGVAAGVGVGAAGGVGVVVGPGLALTPPHPARAKSENAASRKRDKNFSDEVILHDDMAGLPDEIGVLLLSCATTLAKTSSSQLVS